MIKIYTLILFNILYLFEIYGTYDRCANFDFSEDRSVTIKIVNESEVEVKKEQDEVPLLYLKKQLPPVQTKNLSVGNRNPIELENLPITAHEQIESHFQLAEAIYYADQEDNEKGFFKSFRMAFYWYKKAAELGHQQSQYKIGKAYHMNWSYDGNKEERYIYAIHWYSKAIRGDDTVSQKAFKKLNHIAKQYKNPHAYYTLGCLYEGEICVKKNYESALTFYKEAFKYSQSVEESFKNEIIDKMKLAHDIVVAKKNK